MEHIKKKKTVLAERNKEEETRRGDTWFHADPVRISRGKSETATPGPFVVNKKHLRVTIRSHMAFCYLAKRDGYFRENYHLTVQRGTGKILSHFELLSRKITDHKTRN